MSNNKKTKPAPNSPKKGISSPGKPAGSDQTASGSRIQSNKNPYKNLYDFHNMYIEQSGKNLNGKGQVLRFTLSCNGYSFSANIDPNHLSDSQEKRVVQVDVLTGIVLQDFGYTPEMIELRGTTASKYYQKILEMDTVFKNQSNQGQPTVCTLVIEGRTYTGVWKGFQFERRALENTYNYDINFIVMNPGQISDTHATSSSLISAKKVAVAAGTANGKNQVKKISYSGKTPRDYVKSTTDIPGNKRIAALSYLRNNWNTSPNNKRSYPGDDARLKNGEELVIPISWSNVLSSVSGSSSGPMLSGNLTATG